MKIKSKIFIIAFSLLILSIAFCIGISAAAIIPGDMNGDSDVNVDDAIYLLRHTLFPEKFPLNESVSAKNTEISRLTEELNTQKDLLRKLLFLKLLKHLL